MSFLNSADSELVLQSVSHQCGLRLARAKAQADPVSSIPFQEGSKSVVAPSLPPSSSLPLLSSTFALRHFAQLTKHRMFQTLLAAQMSGTEKTKRKKAEYMSLVPPLPHDEQEYHMRNDPGEHIKT